MSPVFQNLNFLSRKEKSNDDSHSIVATQFDGSGQETSLFGFVSLVPFSVHLPPLQTSMLINTEIQPLDKISLKQTFLLLTWFFLFSQSIPSTSSTPISGVKLVNLPRRRNIFTTVRAPIAHKTFSKEQFKFELFRITIVVVMSNEPLLNLNAVFAMIYQLEMASFATETNLLFLRYSLFRWVLSDRCFFQRV